MKLRVLGACRPGKWFGCKAPIDADGLSALLHSVPEMKQQEIVNIIAPGQIQTPLPPHSVDTIVSVVAHPDNRKYGLFHWKELQTIWLRRETLEDVVSRGLFRSGDSYPELVRAISRLGLESVDIDLA